MNYLEQQEEILARIAEKITERNDGGLKRKSTTLQVSCEDPEYQTRMFWDIEDTLKEKGINAQIIGDTLYCKWKQDVDFEEYALYE